MRSPKPENVSNVPVPCRRRLGILDVHRPSSLVGLLLTWV